MKKLEFKAEDFTGTMAFQKDKDLHWHNFSHEYAKGLANAAQAKFDAWFAENVEKGVRVRGVIETKETFGSDFSWWDSELMNGKVNPNKKGVKYTHTALLVAIEEIVKKTYEGSIEEVVKELSKDFTWAVTELDLAWRVNAVAREALKECAMPYLAANTFDSELFRRMEISDHALTQMDEIEKGMK